MVEKLIDPYEHFYSLGDALYRLKLMENVSYREEEEDLQDLFLCLTAHPWWRAPFHHLETYWPRHTKHRFRDHHGKITIRKALDLFFKERQDVLRSEFRKENYLLYGFPIGGQPTHLRQRVPCGLFEQGCEIDWDRSVVTNGTRSFESVRVVDFEDPFIWQEHLQIQGEVKPEPIPAPVTTHAPQPTISPRRGPGQPRKGNAIQKAYDFLKASGGINFHLELKDTWPLISQKARELEPPSPNAKIQDGPKLRTIKKTIGEQYERDRAAFLKKQASKK